MLKHKDLKIRLLCIKKHEEKRAKSRVFEKLLEKDI